MYTLPKMDLNIHQIEDEIYLILQSDKNCNTKVYIIYTHRKASLFYLLLPQSLVKIPHSVLLTLESMDDLLPNSAQYVAVTNMTSHPMISLEYVGLQSRRLWSYELHVQTCNNITVANTSQLSMLYIIIIILPVATM